MKPLLLTVIVVALAGCGTSDRPDAAPDSAASAQAPVVASEAAVAAVLQSAGKPLATVSFVLEGKPVLGTATTLRLNITGPDPVPTLLLSAQGEGLAMDPANAAASLALAEAGAVVSHQLEFTPQRAGLTEIVLRLRDADANNPETVYVVPLLVAAAAAG
jgi:hypothetical protein